MTTALAARDRRDATGHAGRARYFPGFESIRALAASMVVVHHAVALSGAANARWLGTPAAVMDGGVSVFFVLSGFLIYRPFVTADLDRRHQPSWRSFWWRRVLRIVPAYWVALTFFWMAGAYDLGPQWWRYYLFLQIYSPSTAFGGIIQAWSLCTEMSFYVLLPLWAALVVRATTALVPGRRIVGHLIGCGVLWIGGYASRTAIEHLWPGRRGLSFNWLPTNLDLFATGMALAVVSVWAATDPAVRVRLDRLAARAGVCWAGAAAVFALYAYRVGATTIEAGYAGWFWHRRQLTMELFAVLLLLPAVFGPQDRGLLRRAWSLAPIVWLGWVSYGLYLWHFDWMKQAVSAPGRPGWDPSAAGDANLLYLLVVGFGLGLLCAGLSWYLLERPLQRWKDLVASPAWPDALGWANRAR